MTDLENVALTPPHVHLLLPLHPPSSTPNVILAVPSPPLPPRPSFCLCCVVYCVCRFSSLAASHQLGRQPTGLAHHHLPAAQEPTHRLRYDHPSTPFSQKAPRYDSMPTHTFQPPSSHVPLASCAHPPSLFSVWHPNRWRASGCVWWSCGGGGGGACPGHGDLPVVPARRLRKTTLRQVRYNLILKSKLPLKDKAFVRTIVRR